MYIVVFAYWWILGFRFDPNHFEYLKFKDNERVVFEWGVGGDNKMNSSSWILNEFLKR